MNFKEEPKAEKYEAQAQVSKEKERAKLREEPKKNRWMEGVNEVQNEIQQMLEKIQQNGVLNKKDKEELNAFDGLCGELLKIVFIKKYL